MQPIKGPCVKLPEEALVDDVRSVECGSGSLHKEDRQI